MRKGQRYSRWTSTLCTLCFLLLVHTLPTWAQRSAGDVLDDGLITGKVKASLAADPQVSALAIDVDTANGIVTLTGVVDSAQARQRAIQLAQATTGVKQVEARNLRLHQ